MTRTKKTNFVFLSIVIFYIAMSFVLSYIREYIMIPLPISLIVSQLLILIPIIIFVIKKKYWPINQVQHTKLKGLVILLLIVFTYLMIPLIAVINALSMLFVENTTVGVMEGISSFPLIISIFFIAILPACSEEVVFRGVFYHSYRENGIGKGIFMSGFLFGLMHLNFNQFCYAFVMGMIFALLIEATGSIYAPILVHFCFNCNSVILTKMMDIANKMGVSTGVETTILGSQGTNPEYKYVLIIAILGLGVVSLFTTAAAVVIYISIAYINGRLPYIKDLFTGKLRFRSSKDRIWDGYLISAVLICFLFMVYRTFRI